MVSVVPLPSLGRRVSHRLSAVLSSPMAEHCEARVNSVPITKEMIQRL